MRIAFVVPGQAGGGARVIALFAGGLLARGHEVRVFYPRLPFCLEEVVRDAYLQIRYRSRDKWFRQLPQVAQQYDRLTPEVVGRNDMLIGVGVNCTLAIADLPAACGVKVHNCHGKELQHMEKMHQAWQLHMPRIVVASYLEREMRQHGTGDDIYVVHNGVDRSQYYPSVPDGQRNGVGTVYHGAYTKGPDLMFEVFRRIYERSPHTRLIMFGSFPRPKGLPPGTTYARLPTIRAARDLYSQAQVWLCTSRSEGYPGPVLEGMACGCALVSTDCGGAADQIEDGVNGFLVPVGDADRMTQRVLELLQQPALRRRFAVACEARLAQLTWPKAVADFEAALTAIAAKARAAVVGVPGSPGFEGSRADAAGV